MVYIIPYFALFTQPYLLISSNIVLSSSNLLSTTTVYPFTCEWVFGVFSHFCKAPEKMNLIFLCTCANISLEWYVRVIVSAYFVFMAAVNFLIFLQVYMPKQRGRGIYFSDILSLFLKFHKLRILLHKSVYQDSIEITCTGQSSHLTFILDFNYFCFTCSCLSSSE